MKVSVVRVFSAIVCLSSLCWAQVEWCGVSLVVVGSTGDLARRYLWPAIFHEFQKTECGGSGELPSLPSSRCRLVVAGCSRSEEEGSLEEWWLELLNRVKCTTLSCELCLHKFVKTAIRHVSSTGDFKLLSSQLSAAHEHLSYRLNEYREVGRVFYLAVPPSAYLGLVQEIGTHGRPDKKGWLRVVMEKPFGKDLSSAEHLMSDLAVYLKPDEMYLVDHYLGKVGVQSILPFRSVNADILGPVWNRNHVQRVEVGVKERLGIKGRASFFDKYGIVRDMHQNHLMELLVRVLINTDSLNETNFLERKKDFLMKVCSPSITNSILGQYEDYQLHLEDEGLSALPSSTLTFATVKLQVQDYAWIGVPLFLSAGKLLDERKAYIKVVFTKKTFSIATPEKDCPTEIIFLIQDEEIGMPGFLFSADLGDLRWGSNKPKLIQRGICSYKFLQVECDDDDLCSNAYVSVVANVLTNRRDQFVDIESLLLSWKVWDLLLFELNQTKYTLLKYSSETISNLDFLLEGERMVPVMSASVHVADPCADGNHVQIRGADAIIGHKYSIAACLLKRLTDEARSAAHAHGVYHLALPGGDSPKPLLELLSQTSERTFPWSHTHIWQTDERCVPSNHSFSNWNQLQRNLLSRVAIPYQHLHPIPVGLHCGLCKISDLGFELYEKQIWDHTGTGCMDHVVLGVGRDGHIASLFHARDMLKVNASKQGKVWLVERHTTDKRMTLSFDMILSARAISVIVSGDGKGGIWRALIIDTENTELEPTPILALLRLAASRDVKLYLYIDQSQVQDFQITGN